MTEDNYDCKVCGEKFEEKEDLTAHGKDNHPVFTETYAKESRESEIKKEIKRLQNIIQVASEENPLHMYLYNDKIDELKNELTSLGEAKCDDCGADYDSNYVLDKHQKAEGHEEDEYSDDMGDFTDKPKKGKYDDRPVVQGEPVGIVGEIEQQVDKPIQSHDDWKKELEGLQDEYSEEGGAGSGPSKGGTALLPEQSAMKNINPDYDPFKAERPMVDPSTIRTTEEAPEDDLQWDDKTNHYVNKSEEQEEETVSFKKNWGDVSDLTNDEKDETVEFPKNWGDKEDAEEDGGADDPLKRVADLAENYRFLSKDVRAKIFESLGLTQGDASILAGLQWNELTRPIRVEASEAYAKEELDIPDEEYEQEQREEAKQQEEDDEDKVYENFYNLEKNHSSPDFKKKAIECNRCNEKFYNRIDRDVHYNEVHATEDTYNLPEECPFCNIELPEGQDLDYHMSTAHGAHVSSDYTQTGVDAGMADADWDKLEYAGASRKKASEVGTEMCTCGHYGGSTREDRNQHDDRFQQGHGSCRVCNCDQFTWTTSGTESKAREGGWTDDYLSIKTPTVGDIPSFVSSMAKGYGRQLGNMINDKRGEWKIQTREDGQWKDTDYGGVYAGKDGAEFDANNMPQITRVVKVGESRARETDPDCDECGGDGYWDVPDRNSEDGLRQVPCEKCDDHDQFDTHDESYAKESNMDQWWWKDVKWESGFDQDFLYCNHCGADLYAEASWVEPLNNVGDDKMNRVVPDHLRNHGISESYSKETLHGDTNKEGLFYWKPTNEWLEDSDWELRDIIEGHPKVDEADTRWVKGQDEKWHEIDSSDRDYEQGLSEKPEAEEYDENWIEPKEKAKLEYEKWKKAGNKPISDYDFDLEIEEAEEQEEPVEKWDKDDDIGRNYAEPTGDDEPLDDDSYWQGRMEEAEKQVPLTSTGMAEEPDEEGQKEIEDFVNTAVSDIFKEMPEKPEAEEIVGAVGMGARAVVGAGAKAGTNVAGRIAGDEEEGENECEGCGRLEDYLNDENLCEDCEREAGIDRKESERDAYD